jgi:hypothetical protein
LVGQSKTVSPIKWLEDLVGQSKTVSPIKWLDDLVGQFFLYLWNLIISFLIYVSYYLLGIGETVFDCRTKPSSHFIGETVFHKL